MKGKHSLGSFNTDFSCSTNLVRMKPSVQCISQKELGKGS